MSDEEKIKSKMGHYVNVSPRFNNRMTYIVGVNRGKCRSITVQSSVVNHDFIELWIRTGRSRKWLACLSRLQLVQGSAKPDRNCQSVTMSFKSSGRIGYAFDMDGCRVKFVTSYGFHICWELVDLWISGAGSTLFWDQLINQVKSGRVKLPKNDAYN